MYSIPKLTHLTSKITKSPVRALARMTWLILMWLALTESPLFKQHWRLYSFLWVDFFPRHLCCYTKVTVTHGNACPTAAFCWELLLVRSRYTLAGCTQRVRLACKAAAYQNSMTWQKHTIKKILQSVVKSEWDLTTTCKEFDLEIGDKELSVLASTYWRTHRIRTTNYHLV